MILARLLPALLAFVIAGVAYAIAGVTIETASGLHAFLSAL